MDELQQRRISNGVAVVPDGPGLGIDIDESVFDDYPHIKGDTYAEVFTDHETGRINKA